MSATVSTLEFCAEAHELRARGMALRARARPWHDDQAFQEEVAQRISTARCLRDIDDAERGFRLVDDEQQDRLRRHVLGGDTA